MFSFQIWTKILILSGFFFFPPGLEITLLFSLEKEKILHMHVTQKKTCLFSVISKWWIIGGLPHLFHCTWDVLCSYISCLATSRPGFATEMPEEKLSIEECSVQCNAFAAVPHSRAAGFVPPGRTTCSYQHNPTASRVVWLEIRVYFRKGYKLTSLWSSQRERRLRTNRLRKAVCFRMQKSSCNEVVSARRSGHPLAGLLHRAASDPSKPPFLLWPHTCCYLHFLFILREAA